MCVTVVDMYVRVDVELDEVVGAAVVAVATVVTIVGEALFGVVVSSNVVVFVAVAVNAVVVIAVKGPATKAGTEEAR